MTKLAKIRHDRGLSQSQLAAKSDVSIRMIQYYEQGRDDINKAQVGTVKRIAQALDCTIAELID